MIGNDGNAADYLDQFWDETIRGDSSRPPALDPHLARTVRRVHGLNDAVVPDSTFARRLWTDLSQPVAVNGGAAPSVPPVIPILRGVVPSFRLKENWTIPRSARNDGVYAGKDGARAGNDGVRFRTTRIGWRGGFAQILMLAVLVLTLAAGYTAVRMRPTSHASLSAVSDGGDVELYSFVFNGTGESETDSWDAVPLDPISLADRAPNDVTTSQPPAWAGTLSEQWSGHLWALSADGSTYVAVETWAYVRGVRAEEATIGVYDARTGAERRRFDLPSAVYDIRLSRDGSRLVVQAYPNPPQIGELGPLAWHVVDTADGRIITTVESDEQNGWHSDSWIDPEARRLYRLFVPYSPLNTGPDATRIVANDLTTGEEIGELELPEVRSGVWNTERTHIVPGGVLYPIMAELRPGVALSPDGKTLAFVHADASAVTLVDAERLAVERTEMLTRPTGWQDRLLGLLSLAPTDAVAKGPGEGTVLQAVYAPDGRHLYVFGTETTFDDEGNVNARSLGLRLIDIEEAEIVAEATDPEVADGVFSHVVPSPNGRDLYVYGVFSAGESSSIPPSRLWRLDAATLTVQVVRDFPSTLSVVTSPAVPDGRGQLPPGAG
ncbi:MAG: hypothetical protein ACRDJH_26325 [Thermomicrobiales bacterium]